MSWPRARRRFLTSLAMCAAVWATTPAASADEQPQLSDAARAAYDRGTQAYRRGEYGVAANEFANADALAPHPVALKWALTAAVRADDPVLGMTLVQRSERAPLDGQLDAAVRTARQKFERRVGAITVACPPSATCEARIDGAAAQPRTAVFVTPGSHLVETTSGKRVERQWTTVAGGAAVSVVAPADDSPAPTEPAPSTTPAGAAPVAIPAAAGRDQTNPEGGVSPVWFWVGVGVTGVLGGLTIASGVDTLAKHDAYLETRQPGGDEDGKSAQTRTNVGLIATGIAAAATAALGVFVVEWSPEPRARTGRSVAGSVTPSGVVVSGRF